MKTFVLREKEVAYYKKYAISKGFKYFKFELEAQLDRDDDSESTCDDCEGDGYYYCQECTDGAVESGTTEGGATLYEECEECNGAGRIDCDCCNGNGTCGGGDQSEEYCQEFIENYVSPEAREALVFGKFYNDGSVDSEFTGTIPVDKIEYAVEYINAFEALADDIGNGMGTSNAGMHLAFMNSENGNYPRGNRLDREKLVNFKKSVQKLLPAMYFMGTANSETRGMGYRNAQVADEKYSAISYGSEVLEYRLFDTCYGNAEAVLDFFIVMARTLRFYSDTYIEPNIKFKGELGISEGDCRIERLYYTASHIDVLEQALREVRPTYKTMAQLKKERGFTVTKSELRKQERERAQEVRTKYPEYKKNMQLRKKSIEYNAKGRYYEYLSEGHINSSTDMQEFIQRYLIDRGITVQTLRQYIQENIRQPHRGINRYITY